MQRADPFLPQNCFTPLLTPRLYADVVSGLKSCHNASTQVKPTRQPKSSEAINKCNKEASNIDFNIVTSSPLCTSKKFPQKSKAFFKIEKALKDDCIRFGVSYVHPIDNESSSNTRARRRMIRRQLKKSAEVTKQQEKPLNCPKNSTTDDDVVCL